MSPLLRFVTESHISAASNAKMKHDARKSDFSISLLLVLVLQGFPMSGIMTLWPITLIA